MTMTSAPLREGATYDVSIGLATWRQTRWSTRDQAFMVSDRGGIPWRFVTKIVPTLPADSR
ncbi:hypothetical protein [Gemmatimonas sp.]